MIQSIGNLALLAPEDNKDAKNSPFSVKAEKVYSDSPMKMLRKISERNTWTADEIKGRRKRIINFAIERWGIDSEARVHISSSGSRNEEFSSRFKTSNVKRSLTNKIRSDYAEKQADSYQLPSVVFSEEKPGSWWEEARNCPECGGQKVELISKEDSVQPICVCGRKLDVPSYKTRVNEYSM